MDYVSNNLAIANEKASGKSAILYYDLKFAQRLLKQGKRKEKRINA